MKWKQTGWKIWQTRQQLFLAPPCLLLTNQKAVLTDNLKTGIVIGPLQSENKDSEYASVSLFSVALNSSYLFGLVLKQEKTSF